MSGPSGRIVRLPDGDPARPIILGSRMRQVVKNVGSDGVADDIGGALLAFCGR